MTMKQRALKVGLVVVSAACLALACGDADTDLGTSVPTDGDKDAGSVPSSPETDSGAPPRDATSPDAGPAFAAIVPNATIRLPNAINPYGLVYASDGALYASGATMDVTRKLAVWRFKDGALDATFGTGGVVTVDLPGDESSFDLVEVSPGSFVVHATVSGKVFLVKLTKDANNVFSFGAPVYVKFGYDENEAWPVGTPNMPAGLPSYTSWGIGLDKSNAQSPKIVVFAHGAPAKAASVGSQRVDTDRWITRVSADTLAFDTTFNGGAPFTRDSDGKGIADNARRGTVLADGSIVSGGYTNFGAGLGNHVVLVRLQPDGTVDTGFGFGTTAPGTPGETKFNPYVGVNGSAEAYGVVRQSTGSYVTTGYGNSNATTASKGVDLVAFGVKIDGVDTSFGGLGAFAVQSETDKSAGLGAVPFTDRGRDLAVLPDDRTVHVGVYDDFASVFVLDPKGKLDPAFGSNGVLEYSYPAGLFKVAVSPDGKHVAASAQSLNQTGDAGAPLGSVVVTLGVGN